MGLRIDKKKQFEVVQSFVTTDNYSATSRETGVNDHTVKKIVEYNADLYEQEKQKFIDTTTRLINKTLQKIEKKLDNEEANSLNHLTTALGTLYDKRALAKGDSTDNVVSTVKVEMDDSIKELSK